MSCGYLKDILKCCSYHDHLAFRRGNDHATISRYARNIRLRIFRLIEKSRSLAVDTAMTIYDHIEGLMPYHNLLLMIV
jgi:hypothetical protein